ncbi:MAG: amidase [Chloroflexota bacterium]|nr:amidase [Chloroflexota bacterium]
MLAQREISPVELTRAHLARIEAVDPLLNSFITVTEEVALRQAREAEREIARGEYCGPLHGVPVAVKDLFETLGVRTTAGSLHLAEYLPSEDAVAVQKFHGAGAVLLGKLNMHEWAMSVTNINPFYGDCRNPWDLDRIPGGSSGGSGAALAAELCLGALGSDTAGSIRIPASLCGVVGLKPTYGRISTRGVLPLSWSLDHVGPMARQVRDVALLLQALAGYDARDHYSVDVPVDDYLVGLEAGVQEWRVALMCDGFSPTDKQVDTEVIQAVQEAARVFEQLGADVTEAVPSGIETLWRTYSRMLLSEALAYHQKRVEKEPEKFSDDTLASLKRAERYTAVDYAGARRAQVQLRRQLEDYFGDFDILLTPATPAPARLRSGQENHKGTRPSLVSYTAPFNVSGLPALSLPCGFTADNLPIGLQIVGPAWKEAQVLRAGYAYEQATTWHRRRPPPPVNRDTVASTAGRTRIGRKKGLDLP